MADGFTLIVPNEMLNRLQVADNKIAQLAKTSESTKNVVIASFRNMTDGVGGFINALNNANVQLNNLSTNSSKLQQLSSVLQQFRSVDKVGASSFIDASKIMTAVDKINQLVAGLKNLKSLNKVSLEIQREDVNYAKQANQIKELANVQSQLSRELERANMAQVKNERNALALETQKLANATKELLNIETQRKQNLVLDAGRSKNNYKEQSLEISRQANNLQQLLNIEAQRKSQLAIENAQNRNKFAEDSLAVKQYANELKALHNIENERKRNLASDDARSKNIFSAQSVELKRQANDIKEAEVAEAERGRQLILQNKRNIAAYKQEASELKRITDEIDRLAKAYREMPATIDKKQLDKIYTQSQSASSINQHITAIHNLKNAINDLDRSDTNYKGILNKLNAEIRRHEKELQRAGYQAGQLGKSHRHLMDTAGQLQRKLALLFSVSAIQGYVNKLITVRGEFELQAKSLEVLLRNKDEANRLWNQTVQLAVKSPFTVKELVTYTKQLAAYRIESDKLYETNKMLADVSAGLGVDMGRLILAFGQVKAANFLRGTELRQFSEAGVNMLEELARRFTALEGRAVSVGDVFERVSKRMVSFADVEAVFKTITSEGGTFYKMQEKQAETLRGMVTNLKDQIALMLNDIGMSNEGVLKGLVSLTVTLVKNWRDIVPLIDMVAGILITRLLQKGMVGILRMTKGVVPLLKQWRNALRGATVEATAMGTALGKVTKANAWLALIGIVASLGYAIYDVVTSASKLEEELGRIDTDLTQRLEESISGYINLAKSATDASKSMTEQREALSKLNSAYSDILPQYMLTHDYLKQLQGDYTDVTEAIRLYYETQAIEQKKAKIKDNYSEDINTNTVDLIRAIKNQIKDSDLEQDLKDYLLASVSGAVHATLRDVEQGKIASDTKAINEAIFGAMAQGSGLSRDALIKALKGVAVRNLEGSVLLYNWSSGYIGKNIHELSTSFRDLNRELEGLEGLPDLENKIPLAEKADFEKAKANFDTLNQISNEWINIAQRIANGETTVIESFDELNKADLSQFSTEVSLAMTAFKQSLIDSANEGTVAFSETLPTLKTNFLDTINTIIQSSYKGNTAIEELGERISKLGDKDKLGEVAQDVYNAMKKIAEIQNIDIDVFKKVIPDATSSLDSYKKIVESRLETLKGVLKSYTESSQSLLRSTFAFRILQDAGFTDVEQIKKEIEALDLLFKGLGGSTKDTSKGSRNIIAERIKLIRDAQKAYQDLNKDFNADDANKKVIESYADAFKEIGLNIKNIDFTNVDGVLTALKALRESGKLTAKQMADLKKAIAEVQLEKDRPEVQAATKALIKDIQKKIDKYELSVELDKIGIPKDIAKYLFGIEATDLAEIKKDLEKQISDLQQSGGSEDRIKDLQAEYDKIIEMENKQLEEIAKNYLKYLKKSNAEAVNIVLDGERQKQQIQKAYDKGVKKAKSEDDKKAWEEWKKATEKGVDKDTTQKLQQQIWKDIQSGPLYKMIYEDPERFSYNMIDTLIASLQDLKENTTDVETLREIQNEMDKLYSLKFQKNPFKAVKDGLQEIKKWENSLNANVTEAFGEIGEFSFSRNKLMGTEGVKGLQSQIKDLESLASVIATIDTEIKKVGGMLQTEKDNTNLQKYYDTLLKVKAALSGIADSAPKSLPKTFEEGAKGVMAYAQAIGSIASAMDGLLAQLGVAEDSSARVWLQNVQMVTSVITAVATLSLALIALQATMGPIGWIALAVAGIAATVASIFGSDDKKKQKEIERLERQVRKLESAYKDLKKAIESAYSVETLKGSYEESIDNINKRITSTYKMIYAEWEKKDTDQGRIDEWLEQIKELKREKKELQEEIVTGLGGSYDIRNTTREFVEAWIEAFNETGDGLSGLKDNFKEFFKNILIEQAIMKGAGTIMQPLLDEINKSLEDDYKLSNYEMEGITKTAPEVMQELDNFLTLMFGENSPLKEWISESADNLTGLQRGIQGITESQADIIAAYLNSMRAYVADNNLKLTQMLDAWTNNEVENPMVAQLKIIATQTTAIHDLLGGLTKGGHSEGGKGLKVFIN